MKNKKPQYLPIFSDYFNTVLNKISGLFVAMPGVNWKEKISRQAVTDMFGQFIGKIIRELLIRIVTRSGIRITEVHYVETSDSEYSLEIRVKDGFTQPIPPKIEED